MINDGTLFIETVTSFVVDPKVVIGNESLQPSG